MARLLRRQRPDQGHRVGRRSRGKYGIIGRTGNAIGHIAGEEAEGIAGCVLRYGVDRDLAERSRGSVVLVVPSLGRVVGRIALLAKNGDEVEGDRPLGETVLELGRVEVRTLGLCFVWGKPEFACLRDCLVFDELGLTGSLWTLVRESADFSPLDFAQRYTGRFSADGNRIDGAWEIARADADWTLDFELNYVRLT